MYYIYIYIYIQGLLCAAEAARHHDPEPADPELLQADQRLRWRHAKQQINTSEPAAT